MGTISKTLILLGLWLAFLSNATGQDAPDMVLGTESGTYKLFTPSAVVEAGGGGGGGGGAGLSDNVPIIEKGSGSAGAGTEASRDDHVHPAQTVPGLDTAVPLVAGTGAAGTASKSSRGDHVHPAQPVPTVPGGLTPVGTAGLCVKSKDGTALDYGDCGSPRVLSNHNPVIEGTADPGVSSQVSRNDHVHPTNLTGTKPQPVRLFSTGEVGTATTAARADHAHTSAIPIVASSRTSDVGKVLTLTKVGVNGTIAWQDFLSSKTPAGPGTAAAGTGKLASREDHVHPGAAELPAVTGNAGKPLRVKADASGPEWVDPHVLTLSGLPALTGHGGNVLAVNDAATAIEWKATGGGGGGGGTLDLNRTEMSLSGRATSATVLPFSNSTCKAFRDVVTKDNDEYWISFLTINSGNTIYNYSPPQFLYNLDAFHSLKFDTFAFEGQPSNTASLSSVLYNFSAKSDTSCQLTATSSAFLTSQDTIITVALWTISGSGGGGGSTGPTIPTPTPAGALKHLRVAAGGSGYELADPPEGVPARGAGTVDRYKVLGMNSDGQTLRWADSSDIVGFGLQDISGLEGKCLVAGGDATAADGGESIAEWVDCITDDDVPELERDIDGLQALTGDLLLGRAEPGPSYVLNSVAKAGGLAWISGSSITPDLQGVTFQTNTVTRPGNGWGVGSMIIRIIDSEDVRMWQQRDSLPGADNVDISHWPGNQWREITPTNATEGYKYYLGHSPPNTSNVTQARLFRTNTSAHFGETEYYGKTPLVDAKIEAIPRETQLYTASFANLAALEPDDGRPRTLDATTAAAIRAVQITDRPYRSFRMLIEYQEQIDSGVTWDASIQVILPGQSKALDSAKGITYYGGGFDTGDSSGVFSVWLELHPNGTGSFAFGNANTGENVSNPGPVQFTLYGTR